MNRRTFLASMAAVGGTMVLRRSAWGQSASPTTQVTAAAQADAIRAAATQLLQTLAPERHGRLLFKFPTGATPTAIGFSAMPGGFGGPGGRGGPGPRNPANNQSPTTGPTTGPENGPRGGGPGFGGPGGGPRGRQRGPGGFGGGPGGPGPGGFGGGPGGRGPGGGGPGGRMAAGEKFGDAVWTNFPVSNVARPGVRLGQFAAAERAAAETLLRTVLSPMGYGKIHDIMDADQKVADDGTDYEAGVDIYTMGLFGEPSATEPWMLQFGGHHLGLNVVFVGDRAVCAPLHTGILPSKFQKAGRTIRGLGRENDKAFDLLATFTPEQLKAATIDHDVSDLVFGPGRPDAKLTPQGLRGADMTERQQAMLLDLANEWVGVLNEAQSADRINVIRRSLPDTRFAWCGPTTHEPDMNGESYFRVHGPSLLIEHAPQGNQGGYKWHVHTILRDLAGDYGRALIKA